MEAVLNNKKDSKLLDKLLSDVKKTSSFVKSVKYHFNEDSTGEPSVWIDLEVSKEIKNNIDSLISIRRNLTKDLFQKGIQSYPYVSFTS